MTYRAGTWLAGGILRLAAAFPAPVLRERLALSPLQPRPFPGAIWLHGASMGELAAARPIAEALVEHHPLIVTANSHTGRNLVQGWGVPAGFAPLDLPGAVDRFLARYRPALAITIEAEFWPNRAYRLARAGIPQTVIGARLSQTSLERWQRMPGLIRPVLGQIALASARDKASEDALLTLGLRPEALVAPVNLKLIGPAETQPAPESALRDRTLLIASSHEDEEPILLKGLQRLRQIAPNLRVIWAPRHPARFAPLAQALPEFSRRSDGADWDNAPLLLADTMGEMDRWYCAAGIVLLAGSFGAAGGHSPWEAAGHGTAIAHGPAIDSAAADYAALDKADAALMVTGTDWPDQLAKLAADPGRARAMARAAREQLDQLAGDPMPLVMRLMHLAAMARNPDIQG